jgi:hypothetical protein
MTVYQAVLQHIDPVAHADAQGAARGAFADDDADDRHFQPHHFIDVAGDGLTLAAFFGFHARDRLRACR